MKRILFSSLTLPALILIFLSSIALAQDGSDIVEGNNQFACDLYAKYKHEDGNIFYSPYSITSALGMTYEGAAGKTAEEIQTVFHFHKNDSIRRDSFFKINNEINKTDKKYNLSVANALWAQKDYEFLDDYVGLVEKYYSGKLTNLDFINATEKSRLTINSWVENKTNNKIKDLIPQGALSRETKLVLTNAIYFKGSWLKQFDAKNTKEKDFRISSDSTIKTQMMHLAAGENANFNYTETNDLQILELPYDGDDLSMLILLPKKENIETAEESIDSKNLSDWRNSLRKERVDVSLPRFKFETKYFMVQDLADLGMPTAFTPGIDMGGKADFSGMTGNKELNIDEIIHQAFVEVNEEGTEAAAATAVIMVALTAVPTIISRPIRFNANHPFVFIIQDRNTGNILFMGRVSDPTKN
jgi:serpin B